MAVISVRVRRGPFSGIAADGARENRKSIRRELRPAHIPVVNVELRKPFSYAGSH